MQEKATQIQTPISDALSNSQNAIFRRRKSRKFSGQESENAVRMHRAISWVRCWEKCPDTNPDERFVFLWISFNAAYADDTPPVNTKEKISKEIFLRKKFLRTVVDQDKKFRLVNILAAHQDDISEIIKKEFLSREYWCEAPEKDWKSDRSKDGGFDEKISQVNNALQALTHATLPPAQKREKAKQVLDHTFEHLYILRNQILHGGATYRGKYNRSSVEPGCAILGACIPAILEIMLDALKKQPDTTDWGKVWYPPHLETPDIVDPPPPPRRTY